MTDNNIIDGRAIAEQLHRETTERVKSLEAKGCRPGLTFIRVGEDPASRVYVGMKERMCEKLGIESNTHVLPETTTEQELLELIQRLNANNSVHGILIQAPLPAHINSAKVFETVAPAKDVDGFHPVNVGKLMLGDDSGFVPCTPAGIHELLIRYEINIEGAEAVVLGRGNIVGKPMTAILLQKVRHANATVTLCHSRTRDIAEHCKRADILIAAIGVKEFVKEDMDKPGATVIDVGVNRVDDPQAKRGYRLVGDVDFNAVKPKTARITPNPGGVGPMTIAMLMRNTVRAAEMSTK
ncbi:MAG: bifunctional 5,10-methylenetetrahydrofolate dehydrogenase/5,10-methenyltetrahydrofolate cyclohydrolase [Verrucomicrobia bacterium]|nr:bifunctional 5,10-methylenetetrahydrofolate dehydrogenase/5,10-methenyltetrahydrofolate cyclohydrolase [Verrucomicrobiota bacterium]